MTLGISAILDGFLDFFSSTHFSVANTTLLPLTSECGMLWGLIKDEQDESGKMPVALAKIGSCLLVGLSLNFQWVWGVDPGGDGKERRTRGRTGGRQLHGGHGMWSRWPRCG
jgi:hypothetical protein